jgi:hypothetical protein
MVSFLSNMILLWVINSYLSHVESIQIIGAINTLMEYLHATSKDFNFQFSTSILALVMVIIFKM